MGTALAKLHTIRKIRDDKEAAGHLVSEISQLALFAIAAFSALALRLDFRLSAPVLATFWKIALVLVPAKALVFRICDSNRRWWKFTSLHDVRQLVMTNLFASVAAFPCFTSFVQRGLPASLPFLDLLMCFLVTAGLRIATRMAAENRAASSERRGQENSNLWCRSCRADARARDSRER